VSHKTARLLTMIAVVLLVISVLAIYQWGIPAIFARETNPQIVVVAPSLTENPTQTPLIIGPKAAQSNRGDNNDNAPAAQQMADSVVDPLELVALLNKERQAAGHPVLTLDQRLSTAAQKTTDVLANGQSLAQTQFESNVHQAGYYYELIRANTISANRGNTQTLFNRWLADPKVQELWLSDDYTDVGVASTQESSGRQHYVLFLGQPLILTAPGAEAINPGDPTQDGQIQAMLTLLNAARVQAGLEPLSVNDKLTAAADKHSRDQAQMDEMTHEGSDKSQVGGRTKTAGYLWSAVGENVLVRSDIHAAAAFDQWWNSPPHHENLMNPLFTEIGLAYAQSPTGQFYYTMVLGKPL
jgi:uncharacterized protein YkwD